MPSGTEADRSVLAGAPHPSEQTLALYLELAAEYNPAIESATYAWMASAERAAGIGWLPDPMISYGYYLDEVETRVGPQRQKIGVRQAVPWFGKLRLARSVASEQADAAGERARASRLDVASEVTRAYSDYAYLGAAIAIADERASLLERLVGSVRTSYASGEASYSNLMKAEIGLARMQESLASLRDRRAASSSRLSAAVGLPDDPNLPVPTIIPRVSLPTDEEALLLFGEWSPDLRALDHEVESARESGRLARRGYFPDLMLGLDYIVTDEASMSVDDSGKDPLIASASLSVPLWFGKHVSGVREADALLLAAERRREERRNRLTSEVRAALYTARDAERKVSLYEQRLVPMAAQSLAATDAAYRSGTADFDALVGAHETALELELARERARADLAARAAALARLIGVDWRDWRPVEVDESQESGARR